LVFRIVTLSASTGSGSRDSVGIDNFVINKTGAAASGSGTLGISEAGTATFSGNVLNNTTATLTAASGGTATFSGIVSGAGTVTKTGDGTVTLSGANTYSGGTVVSAGTLAGDTAGVRGAITNNATVNFAITTNGTYSGAMTGTGALTKSGAATLTTTGVNNFSGATTISAGTLLVNGTNANSAVTINSGATLGGSGSVGAVTVNGVIAPGTSVKKVGKFTVSCTEPQIHCGIDTSRWAPLVFHNNSRSIMNALQLIGDRRLIGAAVDHDQFEILECLSKE